MSQGIGMFGKSAWIFAVRKDGIWEMEKYNREISFFVIVRPGIILERDIQNKCSPLNNYCQRMRQNTFLIFKTII